MSVISAYGGNDNECNIIYICKSNIYVINKLKNVINLDDDNLSRRLNILEIYIGMNTLKAGTYTLEHLGVII